MNVYHRNKCTSKCVRKGEAGWGTREAPGYLNTLIIFMVVREFNNHRPRLCHINPWISVDFPYKSWHLYTHKSVGKLKFQFPAFSSPTLPILFSSPPLLLSCTRYRLILTMSLTSVTLEELDTTGTTTHVWDLLYGEGWGQQLTLSLINWIFLYGNISFVQWTRPISPEIVQIAQL